MDAELEIVSHELRIYVSYLEDLPALKDAANKASADFYSGGLTAIPIRSPDEVASKSHNARDAMLASLCHKDALTEEYNFKRNYCDRIREILLSMNITDEEWQILDMYYWQEQSLRYIGMQLNYSKNSVERRLEKILIRFIENRDMSLAK